VHRPGAGGLGGVEERGGIEVRGGEPHGLVRIMDEGRVRVGVDIDRNSADAHIVCAADHPAGDLAAIGNEQCLEAHSLHTP
jgi:hypothetical protein